MCHIGLTRAECSLFELLGVSANAGTSDRNKVNTELCDIMCDVLDLAVCSANSTCAVSMA
jgi:hypothetical protein